MPWRGKDPASEIPKTVRKEIRDKALKMMGRVMIEAVQDARRFTASRPSAKSGKSGRVETSDMLESIMSRTFMDGVNKIVGQLGFIDRRELYFELQTNTGFRHWRSGEFIEPTFALRDATIIAIQKLIEGMK